MQNPLTSSVLIAIACLFSIEATAAQLASASMLAKTTLLGVQSSAKQGHKSGKISNESLACIQALDTASLVPVFEDAAIENWSKTDITEIEKFLETDVGRKYVKASIARAAADNGDKSSERIPTFTSKEGAQIERFQKTPAGQQFMVRSEFASEKSRQQIRGKVLELLQSCGVGR